MIAKLLLLFCALYTVSSKYVNFKDEGQKEGDLSWRQEADPELVWPDVYTIEVKKMHLSTGLVEYFKYWRLSDSGNATYSRLDSNEGAVKKIRILDEDCPFGELFETHPETTEEESNKMVCYKTTGESFTNQIGQLDVFPSLNGFEKAGEDNIKGVDCVKFTYEEEKSDTEIFRETLWAYYDNRTATLAWVPVRYEDKVYNTWHGFISAHHIWDFYNFENGVYISDFETPEKCIPVENEEETDIELATTGVAAPNPEDEDHLNHVFTAYKKKYNKIYADDEEHNMRRSIFHKTWRMIEERNRQNVGYKLALNKMSDRTEAEMNNHKGLRRASPGAAGNIPFPYTEQKLKQLAKTLPSKYDARLEGLVGPVSDQEDCIASYSFVAAAAVEGALARSNGEKLIKLANQALLDCSWGYGNKGCKGGSNEDSFKWIRKHGLPTELDYGLYANQDGYCNMENVTNTYKIRGYTKVTPLSITALKIALVNHGPLAVTVKVTNGFRSYDQGIFYDPECPRTNVLHSALLVGYGMKDGEAFWIIKSTWGPTWGIGGYMHISMRNNNCGVTTEPFYVVI